MEPLSSVIDTTSEHTFAQGHMQIWMEGKSGQSCLLLVSRSPNGLGGRMAALCFGRVCTDTDCGLYSLGIGWPRGPWQYYGARQGLLTQEPNNSWSGGKTLQGDLSLNVLCLCFCNCWAGEPRLAESGECCNLPAPTGWKQGWWQLDFPFWFSFLS